MKTIKCKITNKVDISEYLRNYNSVLHLSYNQIKSGISQSNIKKDINQKFENLNSFIIQNAIVQAQGIFNSYQSRKLDYEKKNPGKKLKEVYFGGRKNLKDYLSGRKTKEEFKYDRLIPLCIAGETRHKGNRLFNLDFENNKVEFKPKCKVKIPIEFKMSNKQKTELLKVQELCLRKEFSIAIGLNNEYVTFCYDEERLNTDKFYFSDLKSNRVLGIDQNPNYIGLSIIKFIDDINFKVIYKQVFDLSRLTKKSNKSSNDKTSKYLVNKRRFETLNLAYEIDKLVKHWKCKKVVVEDLSFKTKLSGRNLNRLCKNSWDRCLFENKLKMLSNLHGYEFVEVNAAYTSQIGNIMHGNEKCPDMVAASIEIARRGFKKKKKSWFYPSFNKSLSRINEQWKQTLSDNFVKDWKELFQLIKESKFKYRISLDRCKPDKVLSLNCLKSKVCILQFNKF